MPSNTVDINYTSAIIVHDSTYYCSCIQIIHVVHVLERVSGILWTVYKDVLKEEQDQLFLPFPKIKHS